MVECQICKKEFKNNRVFSIHLRKIHNMILEKYFVEILGNTIGSCKICKQPTKFRNLQIGYSIYCSLNCCNKDPQRQVQIKNAMQLKYGVSNPSQSEEIKEKKKETLIAHYGVDSPLKSPIIRERSRLTSLDRYGEDHYAKTNESQMIFESTFLKRYGVKRPLQADQFIQKSRETCISKFGTPYASQSLAVKNKMSKINILNSFKRLINGNRLKDKFKPLFDIDNFEGLDNYKKYMWECLTCNTKFESSADNGLLPRCPTCYPKLSGTSIAEKEINEFVKSLEIETISPTRKIIPPKELDIYIPSHKLAIEFDGIYWHSELNGKDKDYHINKTLQCQEKGIQLIHIFEDEWIYKQEIVKSIIKSKLGLCQRIYARKCEIKEVPNDDAKLFLFDNHLQGPINGTHLGLYYEDELVIMITLGKPRFNINYDYELLRFCNKIDISVVGGFAKLLKYFIRTYNPNSIITYSDIRYSEGHIYDRFGFNLLDKTSPSYYYLNKIYMSRMSRLNFQKHLLEDKLDIFDSNLTEWQNMQLNDYDRIWDCGCNKHVWINEEVTIMELGQPLSNFGEFI